METMTVRQANIAFVHTAAVHEQTFDALLANAQAEVSHLTQPDWLAQAQAEGLTPALRTQVLSALEALAQTVDVVVCTCTTLGPLVDELELSNVFRIDYPMMAVAAASEGQVLLAVCLESTVAASTQLLERAYRTEGRTPNLTILRCTNAWEHFENQHPAKFEQAIADAVAKAVANNPAVRCIVLAQASMASAAERIRQQVPDTVKLLRSPQLAVMHALLMAAEQPG